MISHEVLYELCKQHTNLTVDDINILIKFAEILPTISDLVSADVFIDCLTRDSNIAVVIAEAKPSVYSSIYKDSVVGQLALRENEPAVLRTLETGMVTRDLKAVTQEYANVKQSVVSIKNPEKKTIAALIMEQDITDDLNHSKQIEIFSDTVQQLTESLLDYRKTDYENSITQYINDAIIFFDIKGIAIYANPAACTIYRELGYKDDIIGMNFNNLVLDESTFTNVLKIENCKICETVVGKLTLQIKYVVTNSKDEINGLTMLVKDITEEKEKEKELILKSVAIREIHHRVKNNLQTIASLLRLRSRRIDDEQAKNLIKDIINSILSIAITHEILANNGIDDVDIKKIIGKLIDTTVNFDSALNKEIQIEVEGDTIMMGSDKATSVCLVINELLQNSLKYAFKDRSEGNIQIKIQKGIMYSNITVADNGIGFDNKSIRPGSLGLNIVRSIVKEKLGGNLNIESAMGTRIVFDFKNE